jgi:hypothetical protein
VPLGHPLKMPARDQLENLLQHRSLSPHGLVLFRISTVARPSKTRRIQAMRPVHPSLNRTAVPRGGG